MYKGSILPKPITQKTKSLLQSITFPLGLLMIWELAGRYGLVNPYFLPRPTMILATFTEMLYNGLLERHLLASLGRLFIGFIITVLLALPLGIMVGKKRDSEVWFSPTLTFLQNIPAIAWIPIFILWLGIGEASKVAVIVYASFFSVYLNTVMGVRNVDSKLIEVGKAYMFDGKDMLLKMIFPSAAIPIFTGIRLGLSNGWRALVGAELIAAASGISTLIIEGRSLSQPDQIFVAIFTIGIAGSFLDFLLRKIENKAIPWKEHP